MRSKRARDNLCKTYVLITCKVRSSETSAPGQGVYYELDVALFFLLTFINSSFCFISLRGGVLLFTVVDIETTGLSPSHNAITEIAAARVRDGCIVREFESFVNPGVHIPGFITRLTGISDDMVVDAPSIDEVLPAFHKFLGSDIFVAHNASFDHRFLNHNFQKFFRGSLSNDTLCTKLLANRLIPDLYSKRLGVVCDYLNIQNSGAHRALGDVRATVGVLNHFCGELKKRALSTSDMLRFQRLPIHKCSSISIVQSVPFTSI